MEQHPHSLITTRDTLEELGSVLACIGVAVTARPLNEQESEGVSTVLRWTTSKLDDCSQALEKTIDRAENIAET